MSVVAHVRHSIAEHGASLLIEVVQTVIDREVRRRADRAASFQVQERQSLTIGTQIRIHHTDVLFLRTL